MSTSYFKQASGLSTQLVLLSLLCACGNRWGPGQLAPAPPPAYTNTQDPLSAPILSGNILKPQSQKSTTSTTTRLTESNASASSMPNSSALSQAQPRPEVTPYPVSQTGKVLEIKLYRSYGNSQLVSLSGRIMKPEKLKDADVNDSDWTNLWRNLRALSVKEVGKVKVRLTLNRRSVILSSDEEGMLQISSRQFGSLSPGQYPIRAEIVPGQGFRAIMVETQIWIHPSNQTQLAVLSDIDDTLLQTEVSDKLQALKNFLLKNQYSATPISGMSTLFKLLQRQMAVRNQRPQVPFFYLSGSPLNYADRVYGFLDLHQFPQGSVSLKKWGFEENDDNPIKQEDYKQRKLREVFEMYPQMQFLLFGDSSEHDAEIYTQIASEYPHQVKAIFIHNVNGQDPNDPRFAQVHLIDNAAAAASHLQKLGYLSAADTQAVNQAF